MKLAGSFIFIAAAAFAAGIPSTHTVQGSYIEARTADVYTGPCFANSEGGQMGELAVFGWKIEKGAWQGVSLDGLSVVAAVRASHTLGDVYQTAYPAKAVLIIDEKATLEQRLALRSFAQKMGGQLLEDIVKVTYEPVALSFKDNNIHTMNATLTAGSLTKIQTRAMNEGDHVCRNEEVWYAPLNPTTHAMAAVTVSHKYNGEGLGVKWSSPDKRSAFIASFQVPSE